MHLFGEGLPNERQKVDQNLFKSTKKTIALCKIAKIFRESMPPDPLVPFFLNLLQICSAGKTYAYKKDVTMWCPP